MLEHNIQMQGWAPFAEGKNNLFNNETLNEIAGKYDKSVGQIVLCWHIQRNIAIIPKSVRKEQMSENLAVFNFELAQKDMDRIARLDKGESQLFSHRDLAMVRYLHSMKI